MKGRFTLYRDAALICARENLVVTTALGFAAHCAANSSPGANAVTLMGFGNGTTTPAVGDTGLSGAAQYFNAVTSPSFTAATVTFDYALTSTDYGATAGLTVNEIGLFANGAGAAMPASIGIVSAGWAASTSYAVGNLIKDSNGNVQRCQGAGTSGGSHPSWGTTVGSVTADNTVSWTMVAASTAPSGMWTHALVPQFVFNGTSNYSGTYSLQF